MELKDLGSVITAIAGLVSVVFSGIAAIYAAKANNRSVENGKDIRIVAHETNSMKDALVLATGDARFLEGKAEERRNPESGTPPNKAK